MPQVPQIYIHFKHSWSEYEQRLFIKTGTIWSALLLLLATQKSQTWGQIPVFQFEQNLEGESKKGYAWKELRYASDYWAFYYRKDCSSMNCYSTVCPQEPPHLLRCGMREMGRAEQSSVAHMLNAQHDSTLPSLLFAFLSPVLLCAVCQWSTSWEQPHKNS